MRQPDFLVIGAMKCGTTTLATQLNAQPGVFISNPKEPNYFSDDSVYAQGPAWYGSLFEAASPSDVCGEASTHYTKRPNYPSTIARMRHEQIEPRLIYLIRDPMERLVSHYIHDWSQGIISGSLDSSLETYSPLIDYGRYGWQIAPFIEAFGVGAILLTSLERMTRDPDGELTRISAHIGHTGQTAWVSEEGSKNKSSERVRKLPLHKLTVDNPVATVLRRALVPKAIRTSIRNARKMSNRPLIPEAARPALEATFAEDRALLARHFPADPSLDLSYPFLLP